MDYLFFIGSAAAGLAAGGFCGVINPEADVFYFRMAIVGSGAFGSIVLVFLYKILKKLK